MYDITHRQQLDIDARSVNRERSLQQKRTFCVAEQLIFLFFYHQCGRSVVVVEISRPS